MENESVSQDKTLRILTPDVLYYIEYGQYAGIVLVIPPCQRTLHVMNGSSIKTVVYHFPQLVLMYNSYYQLQLFYTYEQLSLKMKLYRPELPNFGGSALACFGNVDKPVIRGSSLSQLKEDLYKVIFQSAYTADSNLTVYNEMMTQKSITKYQKMSKERKYLGTLKSIVNDFMAYGRINLFKEW